MRDTTGKRFLARRTILAGGLLSIITGCTQTPIILNAFNALKYSLVGLPDEPISREVITKIPYASISAKIGIGPKSLLILWRREHDDLHWLSADRAVIVTRHGRVVKTYGFPENLKDTRFAGHDPVNKMLHRKNYSPSFTRSVDMDLEQRFSVPINSTFEVVGSRTILVSEIEIKTILIIERNKAKTINWSFSNYYWVDIHDGYVWKSRQHFARNFEPIVIESLKPAA